MINGLKEITSAYDFVFGPASAKRPPATIKSAGDRQQIVGGNSAVTGTGRASQDGMPLCRLADRNNDEGAECKRQHENESAVMRAGMPAFHDQ